jgi:hypothetical protein
MGLYTFAQLEEMDRQLKEIDAEAKKARRG